MYPFIRIGNLCIETYWVVFIITTLVCAVPLVKEAKSKQVSIRKIGILLLIAIPLSFVIAHIYFWVFYNPKSILEKPIYLLFFWKGGLAFHGGIVGGILLGFIFSRMSKVSFGKLADIFAPVFALGEAIQRIGCFLNGCCYGKETDLVWGVMFTNPDSLAPCGFYLHPTQLYLSFGTFIIFIFLWMKRRRIKYDGQNFLNYLILHSILRTIVENFRADALYFLGTPLKTAQVMGMTLILFAFILKHYLKKKSQQT